ncbi:DUF6668 family protein [Antribacter gilvus]|uniref:DUF6668 family protein n=1 Tax=Antribacter gilvus TaxID=2304675 RepID=UPI000F776607|nr:DUF6668 family protein [Antribacter gilvus]
MTTQPTPPPETTRVVPATGPTGPQSAVPVPDGVDQLRLRVPDRRAELWIVGAHGGAGESSLAALDPLWAEAGHAWPAAASNERLAAIVVARSNVRGLTAAQAAARQWATRMVPRVQLFGLVVIADAPGRLPKPLRDLSRVVAGGYPRSWTLPWIESWRLGEPIAIETAPREVSNLVKDLNTLLYPGADGATR